MGQPALCLYAAARADAAVRRISGTAYVVVVANKPYRLYCYALALLIERDCHRLMFVAALCVSIPLPRLRRLAGHHFRQKLVHVSHPSFALTLRQQVLCAARGISSRSSPTAFSDYLL